MPWHEHKYPSCVGWGGDPGLADTVMDIHIQTRIAMFSQLKIQEFVSCFVFDVGCEGKS